MARIPETTAELLIERLDDMQETVRIYGKCLEVMTDQFKAQSDMLCRIHEAVTKPVDDDLARTLSEIIAGKLPAP